MRVYILDSNLTSEPQFLKSRYYGNGINKDALNTNEQVSVAAPQVGAWKVAIKVKTLPYSTSQPYSLVITSNGKVQA